VRILFYSDPHFGLNRRENVTEASLRAREHYALGYIRQLTQGYDQVICLGDLFDKASNKEEVILRAASAVEFTDYILAGNHDLINREGSVSSLHLLKEICDNKVVMDPRQVHAKIHMHFLPHQKTQTDFENALDMALNDVDREGTHFLLLHCNFDSPFANKEHELNLTGGMAEKLLTRFDTILIGHEHAAQDLLGGRVRIVGSLFPTSFGDAGAKHRALVYDTESGEFSEIVTNCNVYEGPSSAFNQPVERGYFTLYDDLSAGQTSKLAVKLFEGGAFGVKILQPGRSASISSTQALHEGVQQVSLPDLIVRKLREESPGLLDLWYEFLAKYDQPK
jgi:DNA repair exonuclease SbcCD nuclease subunit